MIDKNVKFPIKVIFDEGEVEYYQDIKDIELNLEDFDSDLSPGCAVEDATGRRLDLDVSMLDLKHLKFREG